MINCCLIIDWESQSAVKRRICSLGIRERLLPELVGLTHPSIMLFTHDGKTRLNIVLGIFRCVEAALDSLLLHLLGSLQSGIDLVTALRQESQATGKLGEHLADLAKSFLAVQVPSSELIVVNRPVTISVQGLESSLEISLVKLITQVLKAVTELLGVDGAITVVIILEESWSNLTLFE